MKEHLTLDFSCEKENTFKEGAMIFLSAAAAAGGRQCAFQAWGVSSGVAKADALPQPWTLQLPYFQPCFLFQPYNFMVKHY